MSATPSHIPVLVNECLSLFADRHPKFFCDVTVGAGGHAEAFLSAYPSIVSYDASDRDVAALSMAKERLEKFGDRVHFHHASFEDLSKDPREHVYDGILADLGVSSMQLDNLSRGFSFQGDDHALDMRMDVTKGITASEVLHTLREEELGKIFREYGEEPQWKNAAKAIVHFRRRKKIVTVRDLKEATAKVFPSYRLRKKIHPLTLIFQALRVYVNQEDVQLKVLLESAMRWLAPGGRLIIISFCSSEDRPVKWFFREAEKSGLGTILTKKVIMPTYEEIRKNPRCRSAKLRCFEKKFL
ncbi:16S rRNA (cytosine(1402)-N(4))-methyltransferase RsmH [Chlamydia abortus]|uniref:16S rRNA (cytosine(1402)-N(4))-methyltransferase RsmH n=1 Tax=Chlamydia abortus TaxID=83555 RepID=UPI0011EFA565|nr:16S rRNA (cytosine(1402)-N(4))-methyltransferase RsmH [Chlamydia abortus]QEM73730.1 16S rRNA (cytosine(1402)-N(4))-methyltransferase RsmH [Chlamydia abortus]